METLRVTGQPQLPWTGNLPWHQWTSATGRVAGVPAAVRRCCLSWRVHPRRASSQRGCPRALSRKNASGWRVSLAARPALPAAVPRKPPSGLHQPTDPPWPRERPPALPQHEPSPEELPELPARTLAALTLQLLLWPPRRSTSAEVPEAHGLTASSIYGLELSLCPHRCASASVTLRPPRVFSWQRPVLERAPRLYAWRLAHPVLPVPLFAEWWRIPFRTSH
mmetsp:Transcript_45936/g.106082  ORF Transcript_45936/g.106082 Transcript_45936/m.106082 type:complete len:222 (+) Transcript_45936:351-1016(+)